MKGTDGTGVGVVEARICREVVEGTSGACFGIGGGVDEAVYAGGMEGAGAHGAGFEGDVQSAAGETPTSQLTGGAADGEELGVGGRVPRGLALVVGGGEQLIPADYHGANWDFSYLGGSLSLSKG